MGGYIFLSMSSGLLKRIVGDHGVLQRRWPPGAARAPPTGNASRSLGREGVASVYGRGSGSAPRSAADRRARPLDASGNDPFVGQGRSPCAASAGKAHMTPTDISSAFLTDVVRAFKQYKALGEAAIAQVTNEADLHRQ